MTPSARLRLSRDLNALLDTIGNTLVDLLARLRNGLQDGGVVEGGFGDDGSGLVLEGDFVALDA